MSLFCENSTKSSSIIGKSRSDTSAFRVPSKVKENEGSTKSTTHISDNHRSYSMGWLAKLLKPKLGGLALSPKTCDIVSDGFLGGKDSNPVAHNNDKSVYKNDPGWETKCSTNPVENVFYTRNLKLDKLIEYTPRVDEINKYQIQHTYSNESKKRKAGNWDLQKNSQSKRRRGMVDDNKNVEELVVDNNNLKELVDNNSNLDDDDCDAEVAMNMENSEPPTIWGNNLVNRSDLESTQAYSYKTNLAELIDNNNNLDDDECDAEVAMYMENSGPPTIWDNNLVNRSDLETTQAYGYQNNLKELVNNNNNLDDDGCNAEVAMYMENCGPPKIWDSNLVNRSDIESSKAYGYKTNLEELVEDNNNLDDDECDAEVAMYMENSGPPTIWDNNLVNRSDLESSQTFGYQTENESPWLRCIEGCYHRFRSPLGITKEPRKGAIRILDPWPCLYRNTQFGELRVAGDIDLEKTPHHWKRPDKI